MSFVMNQIIKTKPKSVLSAVLQSTFVPPALSPEGLGDAGALQDSRAREEGPERGRIGDLVYEGAHAERSKSHQGCLLCSAYALFDTNSRHFVLQVLFLETWTTSLAWAFSWTRTPTRRNNWRYVSRSTADTSGKEG